MPGDTRVFVAEDDGVWWKLASVSVPKQVADKVGCPVILTGNLSDELENGLAGGVRAITHDTVELLKRRVTLKPFSFTVDNVNNKIDVACRIQLPLLFKSTGLNCGQSKHWLYTNVSVWSNCSCNKSMQNKEMLTLTNYSKRNW